MNECVCVFKKPSIFFLFSSEKFIVLKIINDMKTYVKTLSQTPEAPGYSTPSRSVRPLSIKM